MAQSFHLCPYLHISSLHNTRRSLLLWPARTRHAWDSCAHGFVCKSEGTRENKGQRETGDGSFREKLDQEAYSLFFNHVFSITASGSLIYLGFSHQDESRLHFKHNFLFHWRQARKEETICLERPPLFHAVRRLSDAPPDTVVNERFEGPVCSPAVRLSRPSPPSMFVWKSQRDIGRDLSVPCLGWHLGVGCDFSLKHT